MVNTANLKSKLLRALMFWSIAALFLLAGCQQEDSEIENPQNSVYYWKTIYKLDSTERKFLTDFNVKKLYLRYFDVIFDDTRRQLKPNATIKFAEIPDESLEVVPTVFIVEKCLYHNLDTLANKLVDRIFQISETHHVKNVHEIEIDCDWTARSQDKYFSFLDIVRQNLAKRNAKLSVTIRLHQLNMKVPPCDYGVLMVYNTGNYKDRSVDNPIIGYKECLPYLRYLKSYKLKMCVALPNFKWQLHFKQGKFANILYNLNLDDSLNFRKVDDDTYIVLKSREIPMFISSSDYNVYLFAGDSIFIKRAEFSEIQKVRADIFKLRKSLLAQTIVYDLNSQNINNLNYNNYEEVYSNNYSADNAKCD